LRAPARVCPRFSAPSGPPVTAPAGPRGCNPSSLGARCWAPRLSPRHHPGVRRVRPARARAAGRRLRRDPANLLASTELGGPGLRPPRRLRSRRVFHAAHGLRANRGFINSTLRSPKVFFLNGKLKKRIENMQVYYIGCSSGARAPPLLKPPSTFRPPAPLGRSTVEVPGFLSGSPPRSRPRRSG